MGKFSAPKIEIPAAPAPPPPSSFYGPGYSQIWDASRNAYVYQEDPEVKARRQEAESLKAEIMSSLGVQPEERKQQIQSFTDLLSEETSRLAVPQLSQELIGRGLGGSSIFKDALTDLSTRIAKQSALEGENLRNIDEQMKLQQLAAIESGLTPQYARALQSASMQQQEAAQREALANSRWNALLNTNVSQAGLNFQQNQSNLNALTQLLGTGAMMYGGSKGWFKG